MELAAAFRYARLTRRPLPSAPLNHARHLLGGTLPGDLLIDAAAAAAHEAAAAAFAVRLVHLPAEALDEEMLLDQLLEFGDVDSLVLRAVDRSGGALGEYVATFASAAAAAAAAAAEAAAAPPPAAEIPWIRRSGSAPAELSGAGAPTPSAASGCLSGGLSKKKALKRVNTVGGDLATPGTGRRVISFGSMDDPSSAAPERRARYTLPGGRPAFAPGWDANVEVTDADTEDADARGDGVAFSLTVDGLQVVSAAPILLASDGSFATLRLPAPAPIDPRCAAIACELAGDDKENVPCKLAAACTAPPTPVSAWAAAGGRRSLTIEVPGFTFAFDADGGEAAQWEEAADLAAACHGVTLVAVRVMRRA